MSDISGVDSPLVDLGCVTASTHCSILTDLMAQLNENQRIVAGVFGGLPLVQCLTCVDVFGELWLPFWQAEKGICNT